MAHVEEKKLLRTLISVPFLVLGTLPALAGDEVLQFAPGAQGFIEPSIPDMLEGARQLGGRWSESLDIQEADGFGWDFDFEAFRGKALSNPRVREMLGVEEGTLQTAGENDRWGSDRIFVLASFSMPSPTLKAMTVEAQTFGVPIVFRGFLDNSVFATQAAITETFGEDADAVGFGIDPTLFTRFQVETVPQIIVTSEPLDVCETSGCEGDPAPLHDRIAGNIPLQAALEIIASGGGEAAHIARAALEKVKWGL